MELYDKVDVTSNLTLKRKVDKMNVWSLLYDVMSEEYETQNTTMTIETKNKEIVDG